MLIPAFRSHAGDILGKFSAGLPSSTDQFVLCIINSHSAVVARDSGLGRVLRRVDQRPLATAHSIHTSIESTLSDQMNARPARLYIATGTSLSSHYSLSFLQLAAEMTTEPVDVDSILNQTVGYIFVGLAFELLCVPRAHPPQRRIYVEFAVFMGYLWHKRRTTITSTRAIISIFEPW